MQSENRDSESPKRILGSNETKTSTIKKYDHFIRVEKS
jgi:hypothetical protein